ncbi:MAG: SRPBCC domain-containing protein [Chthonomonas sp.]|nr:SRPBCC domain-containing protein [Chthonomonas sp.]
MKVTLQSDHPVTDTECKAATGATLAEWNQRLAQKPEFAGTRRDALHWIYEENKGHIWWSVTIWVEWEASQGIVQKDGRPEGYNICVTKSVAKPIAEVYERLKSIVGADSQSQLVRDREAKDLRYKWQTDGIATPTDVDIAFSEKNGKTGITLTHNRIQTRDEADGLRSAWGELLTSIKAEMEKS